MREPIKVKVGGRVVIDGQTLVFTSSSVEAYESCVWVADEGGEVDSLTISLVNTATKWPQLVAFGRLRQAVEEQLGEGKE